MSEQVTKQVRKQVKPALERLDALEADLQNIVGQFSQALGQFQQQVSGLTEVVDALVKNVGAEQVAQIVTEERKAKAEARVAQQKEQIAKLVADGVLVAVPAIGEKSVIIGREFNAEGMVIEPGYIQIQFAQVAQEFQTKLAGQGIGFVLETNGSKFEVLEVYDFAPPPAAEAPAADSTPAAE